MKRKSVSNVMKLALLLLSGFAPGFFNNRVITFIAAIICAVIIIVIFELRENIHKQKREWITGLTVAIGFFSFNLLYIILSGVSLPDSETILSAIPISFIMFFVVSGLDNLITAQRVNDLRLIWRNSHEETKLALIDEQIIALKHIAGFQIFKVVLPIIVIFALVLLIFPNIEPVISFAILCVFSIVFLIYFFLFAYYSEYKDLKDMRDACVGNSLRFRGKDEREITVMLKLGHKAFIISLSLFLALGVTIAIYPNLSTTTLAIVIFGICALAIGIYFSAAIKYILGFVERQSSASSSFRGYVFITSVSMISVILILTIWIFGELGRVGILYLAVLAFISLDAMYAATTISKFIKNNKS